MSLRVLAAALILAVLGGLVSACSHRSSTPPPSFSRPSGLIGRWDFDTVTKASTRAIGVMGRPFIYFTGVGTVRGDDSVNSWGGTYSTRAGGLRVHIEGQSLVGVTSTTPLAMLDMQAATRALGNGDVIGVSTDGSVITFRVKGYVLTGHRHLPVVRIAHSGVGGSVRFAYGSLSVAVPKTWAVSTTRIANCSQPAPRTLQVTTEATVELSSCPAMAASGPSRAYASLSCYVGPARGLFSTKRDSRAQRAQLHAVGLPAVDRQHVHAAAVGGIPLEGLAHLQGQLTRRR